MQKDTNRLGIDPLNKLIYELAMPAIFAQFINLLYNIIDRIYIARIPETGSLALSGLGIASPLILIVSAFAAFSSYGGAALTSLSLGAGEQARAERLINSNAVFSFGIGILAMVLVQVFMRPLLIFFGANSSNFIFAESYLRVYLLASPFVIAGLALNAFIAAQGESKIAMRTVLIGAVTNIVLDPIFIFVLKLGVKGAAIATVIAQIVSFVSVLLFLRAPTSKLRLTGFEFSLRLIVDSCKLGVTGFIMIATESAIITVFNRLLGLYGGDLHLANMVILQSVMQTLFIPMNGYVAGVQPLLGFNYGAKKVDRVKKILTKSLLILFIYSFSLALLAIFLPALFGRVFTREAALLSLVKQYLPIFIFGMTIFSLQEVAQMFFVATNQALKSVFLALLRKVILLIPLAIFLSARMGVLGVYLAEGIADACSATVAGILFLMAYRKLDKKMERRSESCHS
ncbi:MAG: MATE family efflux transporter [Eubacteriales bacterium]|nr:MATE family efflux transporter [Eubacteriales bacterium]